MVRRFGGGLRELSLYRAKEYWGDVEKLPTLVKSMHQKKPMQVKYGSSNNAKTYKIEPKEVAKYHLAWVNYAPTSGKYKKPHTPKTIFASTRTCKGTLRWFCSHPSFTLMGAGGLWF